MICAACHTEIPEGQQRDDVGDYPLCADIEACTGRMFARAQEAKAETEPETEDEPVKEDAAQ